VGSRKRRSGRVWQVKGSQLNGFEYLDEEVSQAYFIAQNLQGVGREGER
jgi:hypothetical protein